MKHPARGLVLHVEQGTEPGTDSWFHNPEARASAHFGVAKDGTLHQWVDTNDKAWAEAGGNAAWYSVETEGNQADPLTDAQVATIARLLRWLADLDGFPVQVTDDPVNGHGLITHGAGGANWGGHYDCPGPKRSAQRAAIVNAARPEVHPMYSPAIVLRPIVAELNCPTGGAWLLGDDGSVYGFGGAPYKGGANGQAYFAGRKPAALELPDEKLDGPGKTYVIVDTQKERYRY